MNIVEKLVELQIASNPFQSAHICNGLQLEDLESEEAQIARAKLYRDWRNAGESSKVAYVKAMAGEAVQALFDEVLHSDSQIPR